jgi:hypothetical protein
MLPEVTFRRVEHRNSQDALYAAAGSPICISDAG